LTVSAEEEEAIGKEAKFGDGLQRQWKEEEEEKESVNRVR